MRELLTIAWGRLKIITAVIGDVQSRGIAMLFYFTILVPFGLASRLFTDPLRVRPAAGAPSWVERPPVSQDIEAARQQG